MFEDFYGFRNTPFSPSIPTDMLYHGNDSDELIERLKYTAARQLFAVMTGDSGTGKTTTLRRFHDELRASRYQVLYLSDSKMTPQVFYKTLLEQLGCNAKYYRGEAKRQLHKEIEIMKGVHGLLPVVIVDEAHLLDREMLEEIRFLLNFKMDSQSTMALRTGRVSLTTEWSSLSLNANCLNGLRPGCFRGCSGFRGSPPFFLLLGTPAGCSCATYSGCCESSWPGGNSKPLKESIFQK